MSWYLRWLDVGNKNGQMTRMVLRRGKGRTKTGSTASQKLHGVPIVSDGGSNDQLYVHNQSRAQHRASTDQTVTILWWLWTWVYSILSSISVAAFIPRRGPVWPLTNGVRIGLHEANKLISSAQVREKGLKILQYSLKLCVYSLPAGELARQPITTGYAHVLVDLIGCVLHQLSCNANVSSA